MKRPYRTEYYATSDASGKKPIAVGYAITLRGARRSIAVQIMLGNYALGCVINREREQMVCFMRRNSTGLHVKDTPLPIDDAPPPVGSQLKVDEKLAKAKQQ